MRARHALTAALVLVPGGSLLAFGVWFFRRYKVQTLTETLDAALPPRLAQWAPQLADAAWASRPGSVPLERWAFLFAGIIDRESNGGLLLVPRGPAGLGDGGHGHGLGQVDDRPARADRSEYEQRLSDKRLRHISSGKWKFPAEHLKFCALEVFRGAFDQFSDIEDPELRIAAAVAAYNAGVDNVRRAIDAGKDPADVTTDGDYSSDVLARATGWNAAGVAA